MFVHISIQYFCWCLFWCSHDWRSSNRRNRFPFRLSFAPRFWEACFFDYSNASKQLKRKFSGQSFRAETQERKRWMTIGFAPIVSVSTSCLSLCSFDTNTNWVFIIFEPRIPDGARIAIFSIVRQSRENPFDYEYIHTFISCQQVANVLLSIHR